VSRKKTAQRLAAASRATDGTDRTSVRKTLSFSKELEMLKASSVWGDAVYNLTRVFKTLRLEVEGRGAPFSTTNSSYGSGIDRSYLEYQRTVVDDGSSWQINSGRADHLWPPIEIIRFYSKLHTNLELSRSAYVWL
jgi:hypothetical protein